MNEEEVVVLEGSIISESSLQIAIGHSPDSTIYETSGEYQEGGIGLRTGVYMHKQSNACEGER